MKKVLIGIITLSLMGFVSCGTKPTEPVSNQKLYKIENTTVDYNWLSAIYIDENGKAEFMRIEGIPVENPETGIIGKYILVENDRAQKIVENISTQKGYDPQTGFPLSTEIPTNLAEFVNKYKELDIYLEADTEDYLFSPASNPNLIITKTAEEVYTELTHFNLDPMTLVELTYEYGHIKIKITNSGEVQLTIPANPNLEGGGC